MRGRNFILLAMLSGLLVLPDVANAQFSPRGIFNQITSPFRHMLRRHGHFPRYRAHRRAPAMAYQPRDRHVPSVAQQPRAPVVAQPDQSPGPTAMVHPAPNPSLATKSAPTVGARLGWVGPAAWPSAYEDILGVTFAPDEYAGQLRGHGFDVIADTIAGRFDVTQPPASAGTTGAAVRDDTNDRSPADRCRDTSAVQPDWPATRIEEAGKLSDSQRQTLDQLQAAVTQSLKTIKADCRNSAALTAPDRLSALVQTLWTVRDAGLFVRTPLKNFYGSLTEPQQASLVTDEPQSNPNSNAANNDQHKAYQACAAQNVGAAERMIKEIEQRVRPNKGQAPSFQNLHKTSSDMAKLLMASCAQSLPTVPLARLDAADNQLTTMNYAATSMQIAFNNFYATLNDGQKARLDAPAR